MNVCKRAYDAHDPTLRRRVRYEDLLADTQTVLGDLAEWIGLPAGERRMRKIAARHAFEAIPDSRKGPGQVRPTGGIPAPSDGGIGQACHQQGGAAVV